MGENLVPQGPSVGFPPRTPFPFKEALQVGKADLRALFYLDVFILGSCVSIVERHWSMVLVVSVVPVGNARLFRRIAP